MGHFMFRLLFISIYLVIQEKLSSNVCIRAVTYQFDSPPVLHRRHCANETLTTPWRHSHAADAAVLHLILTDTIPISLPLSPYSPSLNILPPNPQHYPYYLHNVICLCIMPAGNVRILPKKKLNPITKHNLTVVWVANLKILPLFSRFPSPPPFSRSPVCPHNFYRQFNATVDFPWLVLFSWYYFEWKPNNGVPMCERKDARNLFGDIHCIYFKNATLEPTIK